MIADLKPYAEYKESGLPWLGQVPRHWAFERTKWHFRNRKVLTSTEICRSFVGGFVGWKRYGSHDPSPHFDDDHEEKKAGDICRWRRPLVASYRARIEKLEL